MLIGFEEATLNNRAIQARCAADSGVSAARLFLANNRQARLDLGGLGIIPPISRRQTWFPDTDPNEMCHFSIIAPSLDEMGYYASARYGCRMSRLD